MKKVQFANGALAEAGFSGLKLNDINKFMTGKIAGESHWWHYRRFTWICNTKGFRVSFQMTYAYFTV
jgi:zinc protease